MRNFFKGTVLSALMTGLLIINSPLIAQTSNPLAETKKDENFFRIHLFSFVKPYDISLPEGRFFHAVSKITTTHHYMHTAFWEFGGKLLKRVADFLSPV